eukprot:INCI13491.24.p1 GENE.INCI13491.24~~INCI13491.24.p1  ORF type:complete len:108 (-),score=27.33 INCI13491.24:25-348(-)
MLRRPVSQNLFKSNKWLSRGISLAAFLVGLQLAVVFFLAFGAGAPATSQASTAGASGRFGASSATGAAAAAAQRSSCQWTRLALTCCGRKFGEDDDDEEEDEGEEEG